MDSIATFRVFFLIRGKALDESGQTIGKMLLNDLNEQVPAFWPMYIKR